MVDVLGDASGAFGLPPATSAENDAWTGMDMKIAHMIFMLLAFPGLLYATFLVSRFAHHTPWWLRVHYTCGSMGAAAAVGGFAVAIMMMIKLGLVVSMHSVVGMTVLALLALQVALGVVAHRSYDSHRVQLPLIPDMVHHWNGRIVVLLGMSNVFLGLKEFEAAEWAYIVYTFTCIGQLALYLYLEYQSYQRDMHALTGITRSAHTFSAEFDDAVHVMESPHVPVNRLRRPTHSPLHSPAGGERTPLIDRATLFHNAGGAYSPPLLLNGPRGYSTNQEPIYAPNNRVVVGRQRRRGSSTGASCSPDLRTFLMTVASRRGLDQRSVSEWLCVFEMEDILSLRDLKLMAAEKDYWLSLPIPKMVLVEMENALGKNQRSGPRRHGAGQHHHMPAVVGSPSTVHAAAMVTDVSEEISSTVRNIHHGGSDLQNPLSPRTELGVSLSPPPMSARLRPVAEDQAVTAFTGSPPCRYDGGGMQGKVTSTTASDPGSRRWADGSGGREDESVSEFYVLASKDYMDVPGYGPPAQSSMDQGRELTSYPGGGESSNVFGPRSAEKGRGEVDTGWEAARGDEVGRHPVGNGGDVNVGAGVGGGTEELPTGAPPEPSTTSSRSNTPPDQGIGALDGEHHLSSSDLRSGPIPALILEGTAKMASHSPEGFNKSQPSIFIQYNGVVSTANVTAGMTDEDFDRAAKRAFPDIGDAKVVGILDNTGFVLPVNFISRHFSELELFVPYVLVFDPETAGPGMEAQEAMVYDVASNRFRYSVVAL